MEWNKIKTIKTGEALTLRDLSRYKFGTSRTGGDYSYGVTFIKINDEPSIFLRRYITSSVFDFCHVRGGFDECDNCPGYPWVIKYDGGCVIPVTEEEMVDEIRSIGRLHLLHEITTIEVWDVEVPDNVKRAAKKALKERMELFHVVE